MLRIFLLLQNPHVYSPFLKKSPRNLFSFQRHLVEKFRTTSRNSISRVFCFIHEWNSWFELGELRVETTVRVRVPL
jgi:hypothetical protein